MPFFRDHGHDVVVRARGRLLRRGGATVPRFDATTTVPAVLRQYGITEREHDVLLLVAAGGTSVGDRRRAGDLPPHGRQARRAAPGQDRRPPPRRPTGLVDCAGT